MAKIEQINLGVQTNNDLDLVTLTAFWKCQIWQPKKAKSFSFHFKHTDYYGYPKKSVTGYATVYATYYTTLSEGDNLCLPEAKTSALFEYLNEYSYRLVRINAYDENQRFVRLPNTFNHLEQFNIVLEN